MMKGRVLVTGGAGFIGSHVVDALLAQGYQVVVYDNLSSPSVAPSRWVGVELVVSDIEDQWTLREAAEGCDYIIHLAAQVSVGQSILCPERSATTNIIGFVNVMEAALHARVANVVYASSAAVYGRASWIDGVTGGIELYEDHPLHPMSQYGLEKMVDEQYAQLYSRMYGVPSIGLRFFNVYGSRQRANSSYSGVITKFIDAYRQGKSVEIYGDGSATRDFIHVKDVARMAVAALTPRLSTGGMPVNVCTGVATSVRELADIIGVKAELAPGRHGDIKHSLGGCDLMIELFGVNPLDLVQVGDGVRALRDFPPDA